MSEINEFIRLAVERVGKDSFLDAVFLAMKLYREKDEIAIRITWAAKWQSLRLFLVPGNPLRWLQAVGVDRDSPVWVAVVRYPARTGGHPLELCRPTQFDAGLYPQHFPSPPDAQAPVGGHTMFLWPEATGEPPPGLVSEYIHRQIDFQGEHWRSAGSLLDYTGGPLGGSLGDQRERHWHYLQQMYGKASVQQWMERHD